jgi:hypothetical protein
MSRIGTAFLNLGKWLDGENPGSGPQDGTPSDGLNGDKDKIDLAIGTGHNVNGTHKAAVIDGANLKSTVVDGSTLEQDSVSKALRAKDLGISTAKLANDAVTKIKVAADVAGSGLKQNDDGSLSPDVDGTTIQVGSNGKLSLVGSLTNGLPIPFAFSDTGQICMFAGREVANNQGIPVPPGTAKIMIASGSELAVSTQAFTIAANSKIYVDLSALGLNEYVCCLYVNEQATAVVCGLTTRPLYGTIIFKAS